MRQIDRYGCEQVFQRLNDYIDRELSEREAQLVREHLEVCEWCANTYKFEEGVVRNLRLRLQNVSAPPDLMSRVLSVLDADDEG